MTNNHREDNGRSQAIAQFESISELVEKLAEAREVADAGMFPDNVEDAEQAIHDDALSVEVRTDWYAPGEARNDPHEYRILLCTGGPAVRLVGNLSEHGEPETARLEFQDWFTPWVELRAADIPDWQAVYEQTLLSYARCFYFGE